MKKNNSKSNGLDGSVGRLALALKDVFTDALEPVKEELREEMQGMEGRLNKRIDTTNEKVQAQLAQHRKDVAGDVRKILRSSR